MNFSTKIHDILRQKDINVKKPQKHDANLQKNSTLYFQVGLIICLLTTNALFEMYFETTIPDPVVYDQNIDDVPYTITPIIEKKRIAMVKPEPKPIVKQRRLIKPPIIKKNDDVIKKERPTIAEPTKPVIKTRVMTPPKKEEKKGPYTMINVTQVPIFPGCEGLSSNNERIQCMSTKLARIVQRKFDADLMADLGLHGQQKIYVRFTIDKLGNVTNIKANSKHIALANEAKRVMTKVPSMQAAKQSDKAVDVIFDLPIKFKGQ